MKPDKYRDPNYDRMGRRKDTRIEMPWLTILAIGLLVVTLWRVYL